MNLAETLAALAEMGSEQTRKTYANHGAPPDKMYGVKVGDMKILVKKIKRDHALALELYDTGNLDAQYMAGLIAEPQKFTPELLDQWAEGANFYWVSEYTVPWMASESGHGWPAADKWIRSDSPKVACAGWGTLSCLLGLVPDDQLPIEELLERLQEVEEHIHQAPNRVRYTMNGFVLSAGIYSVPLHERALEVARAIGKVSVDMGGTACKVPLATEYIPHAIQRTGVGKKRKSFIC